MDGEAAVIVENGVFKQTDVYTRDGQLFAKLGSGFVRLMADGATTKSRCRLDALSWSGPLYSDTFGRLYASKEHAKVKLLAAPAMELLGLPAPVEE